MFSLPQILIIIGLFMVAAELLIGIQAGFDLVLIGSILILGGLTGIYTNPTVALVVSIILSIAYIFYGRHTIKTKLSAGGGKTNIDRLIGKSGLVVRSITPDTPGLVRVNDEDWRATSDTLLFEKDKVVVESIDGVTITVSKKNS